MRKIQAVRDILRDVDLTTKITVYFTTKAAGDDFDPYEKNYTHTALNPKTIRGYVREISPEALVFKEYGIHNLGAVEVICEDKYRSWFELCDRIVIDGVDYQVFRQAPGSKALILGRSYRLMRVVLQRKD